MINTDRLVNGYKVLADHIVDNADRFNGSQLRFLEGKLEEVWEVIERRGPDRRTK